MTTRQNFIYGGSITLFFLGALFWAKEQDLFSRNWFTLKTADHGSFKCIAVLPKPIRQYPVVIYAHGAGGDLLKDGNDLRQMAELGLAAVSLEYNKTNKAEFSAQFGELLHYLGQQHWVNTNAIAWVGMSLGAICTLDFALQHPEQQPQLLVQLSGLGLREDQTNNDFGSLHCPVLLVHGGQDELFPMVDTERLAAIMRAKNLPAELKIIPNLPHGLEPDREVVFRAVGEYCLTHLAGKDAWQKYCSISQWQAEAPSLWVWCLPAVIWAGGWLVWRLRNFTSPIQVGQSGSAALLWRPYPLKRSEIALRWLAVLLMTWALTETGIHLVSPHFAVSNRTLSIARRFLVQPKEHADFEYLAAQPIWRGQQLKTLLEHTELAGYNRELINWQLDEKMYRDFVLSPIITGNPDEQLNWRRPLWEEFYPRIRHESSPEDAARIVVRHLRERVTIATLPNPPQDVPSIWLKQITDEAGFEIIYVAALRSVGVPARLDSNGHAEFWDGTKWQTAPPPPVISS